MANETVSVHILGKDYQVACPPEEKASLLIAATELDSRMKAIRQTGVVLGVERIAVMAALNLSHEVISHHAAARPEDDALLDDMIQRVDAILSH